MKTRPKNKLLFTFLAVFLPFILFTITVTALVLSMTSYNFFRKTIGQDYRNIIQSSAGEIRLFMENARNNMESLSLLIAATGLEGWEAKMALTAFLHNNPKFVFLSVYTTPENVLVTTDLDASRAFAPDPTLFGQAKAGISVFSGVMVANNDIPVAHIGVPIRQQGCVERVLWAELNLKSIWDVLAGITVGKSGQVYILDLSGRTIGHRKIDRVIKTGPLEKPEIVERLRTSGDPIEWMEKKDGRRLYNLGVYVPELEWIVVLSQPRREIFTYLYRNLFWAVVVTGGLCVIAVVLGWVWIKRLLSPIQRLLHQVRAIGAGDLDQKVSITTPDEIGDLGRAFNLMIDSLKIYIEREIENARALTHAQNLAVLGTASSKVTHEVGNFLNNTDMALAGMKNETLSPRGEKILQVLNKESARMKSFIQRFLLFAKRPDLQVCKRPLGPVIEEALDLFGESAAGKRIQFKVDWPEDLPPVNIDAGMFSQVLTNLIKNSLEAAVGPGVLMISGEVKGRQLVVNLCDSGPGMDEDVRARIFEPFFTTKGAGGTGLGMAIVKTIVEAHQGTIDCHTTAGLGTRFEIRLPVE